MTEIGIIYIFFIEFEKDSNPRRRQTGKHGPQVKNEINLQLTAQGQVYLFGLIPDDRIGNANTQDRQNEELPRYGVHYYKKKKFTRFVESTEKNYRPTLPESHYDREIGYIVVQYDSGFAP